MARQDQYLSELFRIVSGALRLDVPKVRNYTSFLADKLESDGDGPAAARLRKLLVESEHQLHPASLSTTAVPVDPETRFALVDRTDASALPRTPPVMPDEQRDTLVEFLTVAKSDLRDGAADAIDAEGSLSLLAFGPPGCGKSHLAGYVARELSLPLLTARLDGLVSSYLGSTSKNIRAIFEHAASTPCVLFLDEFDAIAKLRDDKQELGELKRVVNSFIQNVDRLAHHTILVAATNHPQLLDPAVWRRFAYRIELPYPSAQARERLWHQYLADAITVHRAELALLTDVSEGFSGADIREVAARLRRIVRAQKRDVTAHDAFVALLRLSVGHGEENRFVAKIRHLDAQAQAQALRARNPQLYSAAHIALLLNISKATAHRWSTSGDRKHGHKKPSQRKQR